MTLRAKIQIRSGREDDAPLIISTWVNSYRYSLPDYRRFIRRMYFAWHRALVYDILRRSTAVVLVACDPEMDSVLYGYLVGEINRTDRPVVHYMYVKEHWQNLGIATALLEFTGWDLNRLYYSHHTKDRSDINKASPTYGKVRWRGADTLLRKWPAASESQDPRDPTKRRMMYSDGNIYVPHLAYPLSLT